MLVSDIDIAIFVLKRDVELQLTMLAQYMLSSCVIRPSVRQLYQGG